MTKFCGVCVCVCVCVCEERESYKNRSEIGPRPTDLSPFAPSALIRFRLRSQRCVPDLDTHQIFYKSPILVISLTGIYYPHPETRLPNWHVCRLPNWHVFFSYDTQGPFYYRRTPTCHKFDDRTPHIPVPHRKKLKNSGNDWHPDRPLLDLYLTLLMYYSCITPDFTGSSWSLWWKTKIKGIYTSRRHWGGVPLGVQHLHSENTMVHTSTFRNYKVSSEKKKVFVPPSESICTTFRIFEKGCCFSLNVVLRTPFYHFLF